LGKFGVFGIFIVVCVGHFLALQSAIAKQNSISKPKAKVHRITLSSVVIKKETPIPTPPKPKPVILPLDPEPIVKKPKPKPKSRKRVKKPIVTPPLVVKEVVQKTPEPIIEQVIAKVEKIDTSSIKDKYTSEIRAQIKKKLIYPKLAKTLRLQDIVKVSFCVQKDGTINNIKILNNPKKTFQNGAIKTLKSLTLKAIPSELDAKEFIDIVIPIEFKLTQG
jgi:TonB family protein